MYLMKLRFVHDMINSLTGSRQTEIFLCSVYAIDLHEVKLVESLLLN